MSSLPLLSNSSFQAIIRNPEALSAENLLKNKFNNNLTDDDNEILTLIDLLVLRVECLSNDETLVNEKKKSSIIKRVDQNLIEYLYYLFDQFTNDDSNLCTSPIIDKSNSIHTCQTFARNGSFNVLSSTSLDQSFTELITTNNSDITLIQTFVHEYRPDTDDMILTESSIHGPASSLSTNDQETWLVVGFKSAEPQYSKVALNETKVSLSVSFF